MLGRHRDVDLLIPVDAEGRTDPVVHAHDAEAHARDRELPSDRIDVPEELTGDARTEDGDAPPRVHVRCAQVAASVKGTVEDVGEVLVRPNDVGEGLAGSHSDDFAGSNRDSDPSLIADDPAEQGRIG